MTEISALFWDIGGVLLSDAWDRAERRRAVEEFGLDLGDFEERHELVVAAFETGRMSLEAYLEQTVFYRPRPFTREAFTRFMLAQSQPQPESLALARALAASGKYLMAALNNESRELNIYRIQQFELRGIFTVFFSSCFLGVCKPDEATYRLALEMTQKPAGECCLIDDRALNLECARRLGMHVIQFRSIRQLCAELRDAGVPAPPESCVVTSGEGAEPWS